MRALAIALVLVTASGVAAQPSPCGVCARGDELVEQLSLQPLRSIALDLQLDQPLTEAQYARIVELRRRTPVLARLGAVDDPDLAAIAAALCKTAAGACVDTTARVLRCLADRCEVALPPPTDLLEASKCAPNKAKARKRSAPLGVGLDWGTGWHRSRHPHDGRAWSLGLQARLRLSDRFSAVARIDRVGGRDEGNDADDDGEDDSWSGSITRIYALAGPSIILDHRRFEGEPRLLKLDLLGGYVSTRSQADESGPAAGFDLAYQLAFLRVGARFVQGFGDADDATMVLGHMGFVIGSAPLPRDEDEDCDGSGSRRRDDSSRLALGFDFPLLGYGLADLSVLVPGLGFELAWNVTRRFDLLARGDLLIFPGIERDRTIHQAALAGVRIDHGARGSEDSDETGFFTTVMAGYTHGAGLTPTTTGTGPVTDVSVGWGIQSGEGAAYLRFHGRFGISPDNVDYRALFLSFGIELRFDRRRWGN